jgi:Tol biopolymer transport system component
LRSIRALLALVLGLGLALHPVQAWATVPGRNGLVAFADDTGIALIKPDGTSQHYITTGGLEQEWTADGRRLYFQDGRIWSVRTDGSHLRRLTFPPANVLDFSPAPLPSGGFVFIRERNFGQSDLWIKLPGESAHRLTGTTAYEVDPVVSPDGTQLAFIRETSQFPPSLWVMNVDGTGAHLVLRGVTTDGGVDWSPGGAQLVFSHLLPNGITQGIYLLTLQMGEVTRVGDLESFEAGWGGVEFSPNGRRLLVTSDSDVGDDLFSVALDGTDRRDIVVGGLDYYFGPGSWQPLPE